MTPGWILDVFAGLMLAVAVASAARLAAARLAAARAWPRGPVATDTGIAHLLMAIAMAGMLVSGLRTLPDAGWEVVFAVMTAWFGYRVICDARATGARALAGGHCAPHLVHSAAMLYMFLALVPPGGAGQGMSGMGGSADRPSLAVPTLAFLFALVLAGYTVWDLDQISSRSRRLAPASFAVQAAVPAAVPAAVLAGGAGDSAAWAGIDQAADGPGDPIAAAPGAVRGALLSPDMSVACRIVMGVTMAFMLLIMI